MFIVCCKYTNIYYKLYCISDIFLLFRYFIRFLEKLVGRYFTTTKLLISDLSPVSPKGRALKKSLFLKNHVLYNCL